MRVAVIVISDRASSGIYEDKSGEAIIRTLIEYDNSIEVKKTIVNDDYENIIKALEENTYADFIITSGGTGLSKRDNTPEATKEFCDRQLPGISEYLRFRSLEQSPYAILSRGYSGIKGESIVVNLPGSVAASTFCTNVLCTIMKHSIDMLRGASH